jgi:hypothetical protein
MTEPADLVRSTTRAIASTVRDVPPLRLAPAPDELAAFAPPPRRARRWRGWLVPAAAAAAVAAVALSLVAIRDNSNGPTAPPATAAGSAASVPPYYATLTQQAGQNAHTSLAATRYDLVVGNARTGKQLATLAPPQGSTFFGVTADADGRTFVVDTLPVGKVYDPTGARTWYLLRLAPGTAAPVRLTRLAVPRLANVTAIALSGSGAELAVATGSGGGALGGIGIAGGMFPPSLPGVLRLYSVPTGKLLRSWSTRDLSVFGDGPGFTSENNTELTWVDDDHAIAFFSMWVTPKASRTPSKAFDHETVRVLNVAASGRQLLADSRVVWSLTESAQPVDHPDSCMFGEGVLVAADGKSIVCPAITEPAGPYHKGLHWTVRWLTYSTTAPTVARVLETITVPESFASGLVLNAEPISASSPAVIAIWFLFENDHPAADLHVGLVSQGTLRELPVKLVIDNPNGGSPAIAW